MSDVNQRLSSFPFYLDHPDRWVFWDNGFSDVDCDEIIEVGSRNRLDQSTVFTSEGLDVDTTYRKSNTTFLFPSDIRDVFMKLRYMVMDLNSRYFRYDVTGFSEGLQFAEYRSPDGNYNWHVDRIGNFIPRKLSISVQLSDPDSYEGGDLELCDADQNDENYIMRLPRARGKLLMFPSWMPHRVTPVTSGVRHSLVGWVTGPPFR